MVAVPSRISAADLLSKQQPNFSETECGSNILQSLDKFVEDTGRTANAYTTLGITYLSCGNLSLAEDRFNYAIELARKDSNSFAELVARYGLLEIDFLLGKINEKEREALIKDISSKLPNRRGLRKIFR